MDARKWLPRNQKTLVEPYLERYEVRILARVVLPEPSQPERVINTIVAEHLGMYEVYLGSFK